MGLLAVAGALKLIDLPTFIASFEEWTTVPHVLRVPVGVAVPTIEILVSGMWFASLWRRQVIWGAVALLATLASASLVQSVLGEPPACRCLGAMVRFDNARLAAVWAVGKSLVLLALLLPAIVGRAYWPQSEQP